MFPKFIRKTKNNKGFNMIELMVVVVIVGILAAIAVPIYSRYARNARVTEATGKIGDILTAAKAFAVENESNNDPTDADWPTSCSATNFVGDCSDSENFGYSLSGAVNGTLTITATGGQGTAGSSTPMNGVVVTLTITDPNTNGSISITGL
jgi:type IV pilus assembly protein PilE